MLTQAAHLSAAIALWMSCSVGMMLFNKMALFYFQEQCTLVGLQMIFTVLCMLTVCRKSLHIGSWWDALLWTRDVPFFVGVLLTSMFALKHSPMSLVVVFRVLAPLASLMAERFFPTPLQVSSAMVLSIGVMIFGCALYASGIHASSLVGIGYVALNVAFSLGDRLVQRLMLAKDQQPVDISVSGCAFLNNLLGMIPIVALAFALGEVSRLPVAFNEMPLMGYVWIALSCVAGLGISYLGFVVTSMVSATSVLVLVNVNKFVIIFIEYFFLSTKRLNAIQIGGAFVTILGGACYGHARDRIEKAAKDAPAGSKVV